MVESQRKSIFAAGGLLALASLLGTGLLWLTSWHAEAYIEENERNRLLSNLNQVIAADSYDNDLLTDSITLDAPAVTAGLITSQVYRARRNGKPVALAMTTVAPDGYNGTIVILVGMDHQGVLSGVRIIKHRETPGLGDAIEAERSDWVFGFRGKSRSNPADERWQVKKDGGDFIQFTGATITPRAVVRAVHRSLVFYAEHRRQLFGLPSHQRLIVDNSKTE
jgi:electron transport complex protein RnfG